ncbi:recombination protein NinB [uncultured Neisseria sp.]|uniref:recombination protein NinB n=1 Tax=uncultured Neisseria sp. TaxID=237778 RepID=UPI0025FCD4CD|nr:recombination protein NinB [uncultured Neisseria sp.]
MENVSYKLTKDNKRPLMTTIYNNLGVWLETNAELEVCIRPYNSKRSIEQNRRLWKIYGKLADEAWVNGRRYSAETWHEYCKGMFLGYELKAMPDGTEVKTPISTTTLNTAEMTDYQNRLQAWAAGNFGLIWEF